MTESEFQDIFVNIMLTCQCDVDPLTSHFYIDKIGLRGLTLFLIFALKHGLWVLVRTASFTEAVLMSTTM